MAYLNPDITASALTADLDLAQGKNVIWSEFQCPVGFNPTTGDVFDMFFSDTLTGFQQVDIKVYMEQVDTNAIPTVAWHIGVASDPTSISGSAGLRWASTVTTLGRDAAGSSWVSTDCRHMQQCGHRNRIGLQLAALPATAAWDNKRIWMRIEVVPFGSMGSIA